MIKRNSWIMIKAPSFQVTQSTPEWVTMASKWKKFGQPQAHPMQDGLKSLFGKELVFVDSVHMIFVDLEHIQSNGIRGTCRPNAPFTQKASLIGRAASIRDDMGSLFLNPKTGFCYYCHCLY